MSKLITPSLISSVDWLRKCPDSWKEKAFKDLRNQLARDYTEPMPENLDIGNIDYIDNIIRIRKYCYKFGVDNDPS